jgi:molybdenum cofactor biosynthesis protein MoaC
MHGWRLIPRHIEMHLFYTKTISDVALWIENRRQLDIFSGPLRSLRHFPLHLSNQWSSQQRSLFHTTPRRSFKSKASDSNQASHLTHLTPTGEAHMVNVGSKKSTPRTAIVTGTVFFSNPETKTLIEKALLQKGDVLSTARIAGIMAAKQCPSIIPLCHPIALTSVKVDLKLFETPGGYQSGVRIQATVKCVGPTGVEMEAFTGVMGAALTVVDMVKGIDRGVQIGEVKLVLKTGGKSGKWVDERWEQSQGLKKKPLIRLVSTT